MTKYGQFILKPPEKAGPPSGTDGVIPVALQGLPDWGGIKHRLKWSFIIRPALIVNEPHRHDCDEFLGFYGCDPAHEYDFGAEIELALGQDGEKQFISTPSVVCIPQGLVHGPLNFVKVVKPVLLCHIYLSPQYRRLPPV